MAGVRINELPKCLAEDSDEKTHAIIVNDLLKPNQPLIIPLVLKGVISYSETNFTYKEDKITDVRG